MRWNYEELDVCCSVTNRIDPIAKIVSWEFGL